MLTILSGLLPVPDARCQRRREAVLLGKEQCFLLHGHARVHLAGGSANPCRRCGGCVSGSAGYTFFAALLVNVATISVGE